jgi:hypothetical protein
MKMTLPFVRLMVHWRSLVIVLVPLALSPLIALGSKVGIPHVLPIATGEVTLQNAETDTNEHSSLLAFCSMARHI